MNFSKLLLFLFTGIIITSTSCQHTPQNNLSSTYYTLDSTLLSNNEFTEIIQPYKAKLDSQMNKTIGQSESIIDSIALSNLVSDIISNFSDNYIKSNHLENLPRVSIVNIKGLRAPLPKGDIKTKDVFALMPFENNIVLLKVNGEQLKATIDHMAQIKGDGVSGMQFVINNKKASDISINKKILNPKANYYIATSDYLANGGDYYKCLLNPLERIETNIKLRNAILNYIEKQDNPIITKQTPRIKIN